MKRVESREERVESREERVERVERVDSREERAERREERVERSTCCKNRWKEDISNSTSLDFAHQHQHRIANSQKEKRYQ